MPIKPPAKPATPPTVVTPAKPDPGQPTLINDLDTPAKLRDFNARMAAATASATGKSKAQGLVLEEALTAAGLKVGNGQEITRVLADGHSFVVSVTGKDDADIKATKDKVRAVFTQIGLSKQYGANGEMWWGTPTSFDRYSTATDTAISSYG